MEDKHMFNIGDKIVYPMHGAGIISGMEKKKVLDSVEDYYMISLLGDLRLMVPVKNMDVVGIRKIIDICDIDQVYDILSGDFSEVSSNWNQRYRLNMEKIKSGDIFKIAEVVKNLMILDAKKGLSAGEKKLLNIARNILISELVLVTDLTEKEVSGILQNKVMTRE